MKKYPIYVKHGFGIHKIINDETYIQVNLENDEWDEGIMVKKLASNVVPDMLKNGNKVSEACFNNAFQNALSKLNMLAAVNDWEGFSESKKETDQERIEEVENLSLLLQVGSTNRIKPSETDQERIEMQDRSREIARGDEDVLVM